MEKTRTRTKHTLPKKVHGVIEAVHLDTEGRLVWVRAYERRGPTWSDVVLLDRAELIQRLKAGKRFYAGVRRENWASEFDLGVRLRLKEIHRGAYLVAGESRGDIPADSLEGISVV